MDVVFILVPCSSPKVNYKLGCGTKFAEELVNHPRSQFPHFKAPAARPLAREALRPLQPGLRVARSVPIHSVGTDFEANLARALAAPVLDILKANLQHSTN